jgi:hypothetical protein
VWLDELGPESATRFPGRAVVRPAAEDGAGRAKHEIDDGRRGKGDVGGACRPATGEAFTAPDPGRTTANGVAFLAEVDGWLAPAVPRIDAVLANRSTHRALDVLVWALVHPRWEFVFPPTSAA